MLLNRLSPLSIMHVRDGIVRSVDAKSLRVRWWIGKEDINRQSKPSDKEIKRAILREFRDEPYLTHFDDISVDVRAGNVTLSGHVTDLPAKRVAAKLAQQTIGVWSVRSHIRVDPIIQPLDEDIHVDVLEGVATLTGTAASWAQEQLAEELAMKAGATSVINKIEAAPGPALAGKRQSAEER